MSGDLGPHQRDLGDLPPLHRRLSRPVRRRRLAGIPRVLLHLRRQVRDLAGEPVQLRCQHRDPPVPLCQQHVPLIKQLPQPHIRSTQPRDDLIRRTSRTRHRGRIGHIPHTGRAGLP
ncbi:MAG TPA: hypothetical protein VF070_41570 [Streptosporangiaceae bacterium]